LYSVAVLSSVAPVMNAYASVVAPAVLFMKKRKISGYLKFLSLVGFMLLNLPSAFETFKSTDFKKLVKSLK
jgi:hypothetical protein